MRKVIVLDAGHGMFTAGKRCLKKLDPDQTREWFLNDRIMDRMQELLREYDCIVIRADDTTGATDIGLSARVKAANDAGAAVYLSMHHNAGLAGKSGGGTVVYYYSSKSERPKQAQALYDAIIAHTGLVGNRSQHVIKKGFYVIKNTKMPAFLVENGFMDSPTDVPIILSQDHAEKTAQGVLDFLVAEFGLTKASESGSMVPPKVTGGLSIYYPAYTGKKTTLYTALQSIGVDPSYAFRKKIAAANEISGYRGTAAQNTQMYNLLVAGMLKRGA